MIKQASRKKISKEDAVQEKIRSLQICFLLAPKFGINPALDITVDFDKGTLDVNVSPEKKADVLAFLIELDGMINPTPDKEDDRPNFIN